MIIRLWLTTVNYNIDIMYSVDIANRDKYKAVVLRRRGELAGARQV